MLFYSPVLGKILCAYETKIGNYAFPSVMYGNQVDAIWLFQGFIKTQK
jgi:hypothetical protein